MVNVEDKASRQRRKMHHVFYPVSTSLPALQPTWWLWQTRLVGSRRQRSISQRQCGYPGSIREAGRKKLEGQQLKIRAEAGSSTRIFVSKWSGNGNNILKSSMPPPPSRLLKRILLPYSGLWIIVLTWNSATHLQSFSPLQKLADYLSQKVICKKPLLDPTIKQWMEASFSFPSLRTPSNLRSTIGKKIN